MNYKKKLDRLFSIYMRKINATEEGYCQCITCGKWFHWKNIDLGHFISRRHEATRYDEQNTAPQCKFCNRFNQGMQYEFSLAIDKKYGKGTAEKLLQKSKKTCRRTASDYRMLIEKYK